MGRGWIKGLGIELRSVMDVKAITSVEGLVAEYASVFDDALGTFRGVSAKITIEDNAKPRFFKSHPVPFAMIDRVNEELMRMERVGVLRPAPRPEDVKTLRSYLGLVNSYRKFLPGLSSVLHPLNEMLVAKVSWEWRQRKFSCWRLLIPRVLRSTVVAEATSKDPTLAKLREALWSGAELRDPEFRFYAHRKLQMSVQEDCILLGSRVVIPSALQQEVLRLLHEGHPGMTKMKAIARSHVWWSSLDEDITAAVRQCQICQEHLRPNFAPVSAPPGLPPERQTSSPTPVLPPVQQATSTTECVSERAGVQPAEKLVPLPRKCESEQSSPVAEPCPESCSESGTATRDLVVPY
ncbi:hypothetical protein MRX96_057314 [Rhipicephalus microplus]